MIIMNLLLFFFHMFITDYGLSQYIEDRKAIWYFIHFYCNLFVVYKTLPLMYNFFSDPILSLTESPETNIHYYALVPHVYHCIAFKLTTDDLFHHVLFVFLGILIKFFINTGDIIGFYLFFINGLPGGIDYLLLFLYKLKYISKYDRHIVALYLNSWIRCPGLIFSNALMICYILINYEKFYFKLVTILVSLIQWSFNGLYYNYQVRDSYILKYQNPSIRNRGKVHVV